MRLKKKNKGFSLVELIVVMAIMAILAIALAPRLTQYVDKARQAQDRETVNAIYTALKYGLMDDTLVPTGTVTFELNDYEFTSTPGTRTQKPTTIYTVTGKTFTANAATSHANKELANEITTTIPKFKLQSKLASERSKITITITSDTDYTVVLDYDGDTTATGATAVTTNDRYTLDSKTVY